MLRLGLFVLILIFSVPALAEKPVRVSTCWSDEPEVHGVEVFRGPLKGGSHTFFAKVFLQIVPGKKMVATFAVKETAKGFEKSGASVDGRGQPSVQFKQFDYVTGPVGGYATLHYRRSVGGVQTKTLDCYNPN